MNRKLIFGAIMLTVAVLGLYAYYASRSTGSGQTVDRQFSKPPASIELSDRAVVTGFRSGRPVAIVDLMEVAPVLASLSEQDIDRLVRAALRTKAAQWFGQEKFRSVTEMTVDVATIAKHDEYQRPDPKSALRHGQVTIANSAGKPGEIVGKLEFANLQALRDELRPTDGSASRQPSENKASEIKPIPEVTPEQMAAAQEQILFDELDIWHHPRSLSNTYPSFEPLRVRVSGAEYYFRNDTLTGAFAASGHRYGELQLTASAGSLMYLPQRVDYSGTVGYTVRVKKTNPQSRIVLRLYVDYWTFATIEEGTGSFPQIGDTEWREIRIPFSQFKFVRSDRMVSDKPTWLEPNDFLSRYRPDPGYVFAIELGISNGISGDRLFFDRLSILRTPADKPAGLLTGRLIPALPGAKVQIETRNSRKDIEPDADGRWQIQLPSDVGIVEIYAVSGLSAFAPKSSIYMEVGRYVPEIEIPTLSEQADVFPVDTGLNSAIYDYDAPIGAHIRPGHFAVSTKLGDKMQMFLEERANKFGFIDRDRRFENPDQAYRVVILGDSYYMGIYNDMRDAVWNQAESRLAMLFERPVEVIAATHHHAPFINSWSQFTNYALKLRPNMVILPVIDPDILNFGIEDYVREWLSFSPDHPPSAIWHLSDGGTLTMQPFDPEWRNYIKPLTDEEHRAIRKNIDTRQYIRKDIENAPKWLLHNLDTVAAALARFRDEARRSGTEIALGYSAFEPNMDYMQGDKDVALDLTLFRGRMKALADKAGITFLDLSKTIYAGHTAVDNFYIPENGHWSSFAHFRAGLALSDEIARRITPRH